MTASILLYIRIMVKENPVVSIAQFLTQKIHAQNSTLTKITT